MKIKRVRITGHLCDNHMSNHFTRYCCHLFMGCDNAQCSYAHYPAELRGHESMAETGVRFHYPTDESITDDRFIVRLDESDDEEEYEQPSMSLSKLVQDQVIWRQKKFKQAYFHRLWVLKKAHYASMDNGENCMDMSDDESEYGEQDMDMSD
jgi:hypothetical protein